jgi:hypothetical protein
MQFQKHEDKVETHMSIFALVLLSIGFNQFPNIFLVLVDGGIFYVGKNNTKAMCNAKCLEVRRVLKHFLKHRCLFA